MNNPVGFAVTPIVVNSVGSIEFIELMKHRSLDGVDMEQRRKIFSYALATVLARKLPIPTAPVESPAAYFISNVEQQVSDIASSFNERVSIDYELVRDFTQKLWAIRYFSVHNDTTVGSFYPFNFFEILAGIGNNVDEKTYQYVNEYKVAIIDLSNAIGRMLNAKQDEKGLG